MGVPAFYRWLTEKYPNIITKSITQQNPNAFEFDHLYLDLNGIIHPCFHPESLLIQPTTFEDVFDNMYAYIDRLFSIVRPRKLLYLAVDGVAPRAKMNQQRSRRFRNAKNDEITEEEEKKLREKYERMGKKILPVLESQVSDSNIVTPGTEFMFELSKALTAFVVKRLESDPGWKDIKVVISDATVPGEGEHKIMSFIRGLRSLPGYDPNTRHCLYGLDADLIMLALATHEIHFSILREDVSILPEGPDQKKMSESTLISSIQRALTELRVADVSTEQEKKPFRIWDESQSMMVVPQHYEFVHVWILREYLELDMQIIDPPEKFIFDVERIIDDFIFMCLFMGNDFLPHIPTLEIREQGIDLLMHVYKSEFKNLGGYLVDMQRVNEPHCSFIKLKRVEKFILCVGSYEEKIFQKRAEMSERRLKRIMSEYEESRKGVDDEDEQSSDVCIIDEQCPNLCTSVVKLQAKDYCNYSVSEIKEMVDNTKSLKEELKRCLRKKSDTFGDGVVGSDKVKLGSVGWKQRYYKEKFSLEDPNEIEVQRKDIVQKYTEGLCWVLLYYFSGIPSWDWYYPEYYGLFASELKGLSQVKVKFRTGTPFKSFDQLMAVLPPKSAHALPKAYRDLMTSEDSKILEFYPRDFEVDTDGKRYLWQGISKLAFINQEKLLNATRERELLIEANEAERNAVTIDRMFWRGSNSCPELNLEYIVQYTETREEIVNDVNEEQLIMCSNLKLPVTSLRAPRLLEGVEIPEKTVFENDILTAPLWHEYKGFRPPVTRPFIYRSKVQDQQNLRKAATDESQVHKYAGTGWSGAGRGSNNARQNVPNQTAGYHQTSNSTTSRGWCQQQQQLVSPNVNRTSESFFRSSRIRRNPSESFWPSRSVPDSHLRPTSQSQCPPWRPSWRRTGNENDSQVKPSGRGRGWGREGV